MTTALLLCFGAYLLGSIPTGVLISRACGIDIRAVGSGNIGATNVARALGRPWAILVLVCDASKGFLPILVGKKLLPWLSPAAVALAGMAAIVGHMFTVFLRGRGGKGVATSLGVAIAIAPLAAALAFAVYLITYLTFRLSSLGSLLGLWSFPLLAHFLGDGVAPAYMTVSIAAALLVTIRHHDNISRLLRGEEKRA
jgi:acyl phosphate:glycerol-3-phosphate acyltransferase